MIYTSSYFNEAGRTMARIRISMSLPKGFTVDEAWMAVAPKWDDLLGPYKRGEIDDAQYTERYRRMLDANAESVVRHYRQLTERYTHHDAVMLCWCPAGAFCHRRLLAEWLGEHGFPVPPELPAAPRKKKDAKPELF